MRDHPSVTDLALGCVLDARSRGPKLLSSRRLYSMSMRLTITCALLALAGCDSGEPAGPDAMIVRDASLLDGSGLLDAGQASDAGPAASDGGSTLCEIAVCDPRSPDGCSAGSCVLWSDASSCETSPGGFSAGMACETTMDCAPGLACFLDGTAGTCGRVCCPGDAMACTDGAVCAGSGVLVDGTETSWGRCLPPRTCDVLRPTETCEAREGCYIVDAEGNTQCLVAGTGGPGEACAAQQDCQPGFFCGGIGSMRRCVRICRLGAGECPESEGRCVAQAHSPAGTGFCTVDALTAR